MNATEHFDADHIHTTLEADGTAKHFRHGDGIEVDGNGESLATTRTTAEWAKWLTARFAGTEFAAEEHVFWAWAKAGVDDNDDEEGVAAAWEETVRDREAIAEREALEERED